MIAPRISNFGWLSRHAQVSDQSKRIAQHIDSLVGVQVTESVAERA